MTMQIPLATTEYLDRIQAAKLIGKSVSWLRARDKDGSGPPKLHLGREIRYRRNEFTNWVDSQKKTA